MALRRHRAALVAVVVLSLVIKLSTSPILHSGVYTGFRIRSFLGGRSLEGVTRGGVTRRCPNLPLHRSVVIPKAEGAAGIASTDKSQNPRCEIWLDLRSEPQDPFVVLCRLESFYFPDPPNLSAVICRNLDQRYKQLEGFRETRSILQDGDSLFDGDRMPVGVEVNAGSASIPDVNSIVRNGYKWVLVRQTMGDFSGVTQPFVKFVLDTAAHCRGISGSDTRVAVCCTTSSYALEALEQLWGTGGAVVVPYDFNILHDLNTRISEIEHKAISENDVEK
ncbi:hypothetical protein AAMO2058_001184000 [Amorphochlora amoebiformis]